MLISYGYSLEMIPTISTNTIFLRVPEALRENVEESVLKITHTGLTELPDPYFMQSRPDLIVPQIETIGARSYRDLPIRRICDGFRYIISDSHDAYSLFTDTEFPAIDAVGIFFTEDEYKAEIRRLLSDLKKFTSELLKLSTFTVRSAHSMIVLLCLPNGKVLEVARVRLYGKYLSKALKFDVLSPTNTSENPFIFNLHINSRMFAAVLIVHAEGERVILPKFSMRCHAESFGVDCSSFSRIRVNQLSGNWSPERWSKLGA